MPMQNNPWLPFLEEDETGRKAAYHSYRPQWGGQPQRGYYENQFSSLYDQYLGRLGAQVRGGAEPEGQFNDFLGEYDWAGGYQRDVPYETRSRGQEGLTPRTRWMLPGMGR